MGDQEFMPLKGDDALLRAKAEHYGEIAKAISRSVKTLRSIHDVDGMKSQAIDAIRDKAGDVADDIAKAQERYAVTSTALVTYSYALKSAQDDAATAIAHINHRESELQSAQHTATTAKGAAETADPTDTASQKAASDAQDDVTAAAQSLDAAQQEWRDALEAKNSAAEAAIKSIVEVVSGKKNHGLEDSWWDDWGATVYDIFKTICDWAGILSIFLGWVPILGQILIVLGTIGAILDLIDAVIKTITEGGSGWDIVWAAAGVALSFVGGKAFSQLAKNLKSAALMKTLPVALKDEQAMKSMRGILKLKAGESMVPQALEASKNLKMGFKDTLKAMFSGSLKDLEPKALLGPGKTGFKDVVGALKEAKLIPDLDPAKLLKLNRELIDVAKFVKLNPAILKEPTIAIQLVGVAAYQAETTWKATQDLSDPKTYLSETVYGVK